jgi:hypothetical protein
MLHGSILGAPGKPAFDATQAKLAAGQAGVRLPAHAVHMELPENQRIAAQLREAADRLDAAGDNRFRAAAYRRAARSVDASPRSLRSIYERHGPVGLEGLPGVGPALADAITEMLISGRWKYLERLSTERVIRYVDEKGAERECSVLQARPRSSLHGRDAIAALLARG